METVERPCAYHEERASVASCSECNSAICEECRQDVAGHVVCAKCLEEIKSRVSAQMDAEQPQAPPMPVTPGDSSGATAAHIPAYESMPVNSSPIADSVPVVPPNPLRILAGIALGLVAGFIGAFIRAQVMHRTHIMFGLIDSFIGFGVGFAVVMGSGRSGIVPAIIGGLIAFGAIAYGHYLFQMYEIQAVIRNMGGESGASLPQMPSFIRLAPEIIKGWGVMDWVFVAIGVYGGFITPMRANAPSAVMTS